MWDLEVVLWWGGGAMFVWEGLDSLGYGERYPSLLAVLALSITLNCNAIKREAANFINTHLSHHTHHTTPYIILATANDLSKDDVSFYINSS